MRECITIDNSQRTTKNFSPVNKPLVSILLAVYKPNEAWFIEQLISLNNQTYDNIELIIYDDCPDFPVDETLISKHIDNFSYTLIRGIKNEGSNKAFEYLTKQANGEFLAYCDQDDVWEEEKIALMVEKFAQKYVTLVCSDLSIIDENSKKTFSSIREIRKRIVYKSGNNLAKQLLISNFVTGCAMIVRKDIAQKAIPFEETLVHDNWIAVIASLNGKIDFVDKPLVRYRQHSFNQTGILKGVENKETYFNIKICNVLHRYISLRDRLAYNKELKEYINYCIISLNARKNYFLNPSIKELKVIITYSNYYKLSIILEIFMPIIPEFILKYIIKLTKKGIL